MATKYTQDARDLAELFGLDLGAIAIAMATAREDRYPIGSSGSVCVVKTTKHPGAPDLLIITVEGTMAIETMGWVCPIPHGVESDGGPTAVLTQTCERYGDPLELRSDGEIVAEGRLILDAKFPGRLDMARDVTPLAPASKSCAIRVLSKDESQTLITLLFHMRVHDLAEDFAAGSA